jgi:AAA+ superfamily predicted ATPase
MSDWTPEQVRHANRLAAEILAEPRILRVPESLLPPPQAKPRQENFLLRFPVLSEIDRRARCDRTHPKCSFCKYIGNEEAVLFAMGLLNEALAKVEYDERNKPYATHACNICLLLTGEASSGKTYFAECLANGLELPFIKCLGTVILGKPDRLSRMILTGYAKSGHALAPYRKVGDRVFYKLPRAVLFFDECHKISGDAQEAMLTMCEGKDRSLSLCDVEFDCSDVAIVAASNKIGDWGKAIKSRFVPIPLRRHTLDEVAQIVHDNVNDLTFPHCRELVEYERVARKAIDFAATVLRNVNLFKISITEAIPVTAKMLHKTKEGMTDQAITALVVLAEARPVGLSRSALCSAIGVEEEEFKSDIVHQLLRSDSHPSLVTVSNRHKITEDGVTFLIERGLLNDDPAQVD